MTAVNWGEIERRWQAVWEERRIFEANPDGRPKKMITVAYPYPNSPQHIGHGRTYTLADIDARFWRMRGYNVLFPMGFHYTGTPILGMARRVQGRDAELLAGLRDIFGVPQEDIDGFTEPLNIANYFRDEIRQGMREMGYSIDWRRQFTTIDEPYRRFIEWQIESLRRAGLIIQGSHPVGWCPEDQNPVSQHDTLGDVEPQFTEYVLVKFRWDGYVIPTATLRPETIFGVTNVWVNPEVTYDIVRVGSEQWVVSPQCVDKLSHQGRDPVKVGTIAGSRLAGETLRTPLGGSVPALAAGFADPRTGTGLVMSVPAHAPFDYAALVDAAGESEIAGAIVPVPIISVPGYGKVPAREICERMGIDSQRDDRLEEATTQIYNKEFYEGVLRGELRQVRRPEGLRVQGRRPGVAAGGERGRGVPRDGRRGAVQVRGQVRGQDADQPVVPQLRGRRVEAGYPGLPGGDEHTAPRDIRRVLQRGGLAAGAGVRQAARPGDQAPLGRQLDSREPV